MQAQRINITLPGDLAKQFQNSIPQGQRSKFIADAVEKKLKEEDHQKVSLEESLKINYEFDKKVAKDWEIAELEGWPD